MLHHNEIAIRKIGRWTDSAVLLERIEIHLRTRGDLGRDVDRWTPGHVNARRILAELLDALAGQSGRD
jgi:hypothetical protein